MTLHDVCVFFKFLKAARPIKVSFIYLLIGFYNEKVSLVAFSESHKIIKNVINLFSISGCETWKRSFGSHAIPGRCVLHRSSRCRRMLSPGYRLQRENNGRSCAAGTRRYDNNTRRWRRIQRVRLRSSAHFQTCIRSGDVVSSDWLFFFSLNLIMQELPRIIIIIITIFFYSPFPRFSALFFCFLRARIVPVSLGLFYYYLKSAK